MRLLGLIFILSIMTTASFGQNNIFFGVFPNSSNSDSSIHTADLLKQLNWDNIVKNDSIMNVNKVHIYRDSLLEVYYNGDISIESFENKVLSFNLHVNNLSKTIEFKYFDRILWINYCHKYLIDLPDSLKLSYDQEIDDDALQSYYKLLDVGESRDNNVYGWDCDYGIVGMITTKREAVTKLLLYYKLLNKLIDYPNIYTQLYALEGLIFYEYIDNKTVIDKESLDLIYFLKVRSFKNKIWDKILELRRTNSIIRRCGYDLNFKSDDGFSEPTNINNIISDDEIRAIPKKFKELYPWRNFIKND